MRTLFATALMLVAVGTAATASGTDGTTPILPKSLEELIVSGVPVVDPCPSVGECPEPFGSIKFPGN
jgi:hypothetical protein